MRKNVLYILSVVALNACVSSRPESQWKDLDAASQVICQPWPAREEDLATLDLQLIAGGKPGFFTETRRRDGSIAHDYADYRGDTELDVDDLRPMSLNSGFHYVGYVNKGDRPLLVVATADEPPQLELRNVTTNVVEHRLAGLQGDDVEAVKATKQGFWLSWRVTQKASKQSGRDTSRISYAYVPLTDAMDLKATPISGSFSSSARLMVANDESAMVLWDENVDKQARFFIQHLGRDGAVRKSEALVLGLKSEAESWSAALRGDRLFLALVEGDSLVGHAGLRILVVSLADGAPKVLTEKAFAHPNQHLAQPHWLEDVAANEQKLLLLKWVDEESTIASYKVGSAGITESGLQGVFPKGSRIMDAFQDYDRHDILVMRRRQAESYLFELCEL